MLLPRRHGHDLLRLDPETPRQIPMLARNAMGPWSAEGWQRKGQVDRYGGLACGGVVAAASEPAVLATGLCAYEAQALATGVVALACLACGQF